MLERHGPGADLGSLPGVQQHILNQARGLVSVGCTSQATSWAPGARGRLVPLLSALLGLSPQLHMWGSGLQQLWSLGIQRNSRYTLRLLLRSSELRSWGAPTWQGNSFAPSCP